VSSKPKVRNAKVAMAIGAHPDDIEFQMAGTMLLLKKAGFEIHYMNVGNGSCGTREYDYKTICKMRGGEAREAAKIMGAHYHPPLVNDLEIFYELKTLRRLAAVIREVKPSVLLTHSPVDYMEDHTNTCRLAVTAAFAREMPNFRCEPEKAIDSYDVTVYHALPHSQTDPLRRRIVAGAYANIMPVFETKMAALRMHKSQQNWLDTSQKLNSYLKTMQDIALSVGKLSRKFKYAEAWRRHLHFGFCGPDTDPLQVLGKDYLINAAYERNLKKGF
jgi:N-acetylglucosamine malate deacetylase 1